jgi:hypothetical protein
MKRGLFAGNKPILLTLSRVKISRKSFSAAYGTNEDLEANSYIYYFPYGKQGIGEQYSYSEIALDYYNKHK